MFLNSGDYIVLTQRSTPMYDVLYNGTRLEWIYHRNGVGYYMTPGMRADVIDSPRQRFNVTTSHVPTTTTRPTTTPRPSTTTPTDYTTPEPTTEYTTEAATERTTQFPPGSTWFLTNVTEYAAIVDDVLSTSNAIGYFLIVPVDESEDEFNIMDVNTQEFLVSPRTRPPFDFLLESQYPAEPRAIFSLAPYKFHLNSSYSGDRASIGDTLDEISLIPDQTEKIEAFVGLIGQMNYFNHISGGEEIFQVGRYIQTQIPEYWTTQPFRMLPPVTQLIIESTRLNTNLALVLHPSDTSSIPISIVTGLATPGPIYPFNLKVLANYRSSYQVFSGQSTTRGWRIDPNVVLFMSTNPSIFEFAFSENSIETIQINHADLPLNYFLDEDGNFKFCWICGTPATFTITEYTVKLGDMYETENRQDIPEISGIIGKYGGTEAADLFVQLIDNMTLNNHVTGGPEIFSVGRHIQTYIPDYVTAQPYQKLPEITRLILDGSSGSYINFQINLITTAGDTFPVTGVTGITKPKPIYPFNVQTRPPVLEKYTTFITPLTESSTRYWTTISGTLAITTNWMDATLFDYHFPADSTQYFHISANGTNFLEYFNDPDGHFRFCAACSQNVARFSITRHVLNVDAMYGPDNREDIPEIGYVINKFENVSTNADTHFVELLTRMTEYGHISGREIFSVGARVKTFIGEASPSFSLLPGMVQSVLNSNLSWTFVQDGAEFPMKYHWASDLHENILRYEFRWRSPSLTSFSGIMFDILYGIGQVQLQQLFVNPVTMELIQKLYQGTALYEFELELREGLNLIGIYWRGIRLGTRDEVPDFYFQASNDNTPSWFKIYDYEK
ncbi:hypothetical protein Fcan01_19301 [Folsomia candida]|uniref:Uncharacterized protein n=1 Tax=Folsomia candida TaxID=158441 RepID=A0A226DLN0_FOLCA|nr:hypothetical protein Fcan01_19301 [Folsomia candida]